jgi:hypothetical protein
MPNPRRRPSPAGDVNGLPNPFYAGKRTVAQPSRQRKRARILEAHRRTAHFWAFSLIGVFHSSQPSSPSALSYPSRAAAQATRGEANREPHRALSIAAGLRRRQIDGPAGVVLSAVVELEHGASSGAAVGGEKRAWKRKRGTRSASPASSASSATQDPRRPRYFPTRPPGSSCQVSARVDLASARLASSHTASHQI